MREDMICPKCGYQQDEGVQCLRCGLIFARYRAAAVPPRPKSDPTRSSGQSIFGFLRSFYRIFRWVSLAGFIVVIVLILHASPPPRIVIPLDAPQHAEAKIEEFLSSADRGMEQRLELDEPELNGWLSQNLVLKKPQNSAPTPPYQTADSPIQLAKKVTGSDMLDTESLEEAQSSVRDVKIELLEDSLRVYAIVDVHGMDVSMELEGRLLVQDGYMRLAPIRGKLGSFPLMAGMLQSVAGRLFDSPENKEKFRLPPNIRDMRIEHGQLVITSQ